MPTHLLILLRYPLIERGQTRLNFVRVFSPRLSWARQQLYKSIVKSAEAGKSPNHKL
jgi:hypothetical protein